LPVACCLFPPYANKFRNQSGLLYFEGGISQRQLAKRFRVALSFVEKLLKQYRETGSIAPKIRTQQTPTKLNEQQLSVLKQIVEGSSDATLDELPSELEQKTGVLIGRSTVDRMLRHLELSVKKKHCTRPKKKVNGFNHYE
jgi:putative transposase